MARESTNNNLPPIDDTSIVNDLRNEIAKGNVLFVIGSGVSIEASDNAAAASWKGLLRHGLKRVKDLGRCTEEAAGRFNAQIDSTDLDETLSVATYVATKLGAPRDGEFSKWLSDSVGQIPLKYSAAIVAITQIKNCVIMTTNYDSLIETVSVRPYTTWQDVARCEKVSRGDDNAIIHIHGHWDSPESVILGQDSYALIANDKKIQNFIRAAHLAKTFVYIGCGDGLSDPNFSKFFQWCEELFGDSETRRYRLAIKDELLVLRAKHPPGHRVQVISYGDKYSDLASFVESLHPPPNTAPLPTTFKASAELTSRIDDIANELADHPLAGRGEDIEKLNVFLKRPNGFLLVTGDAGHGKSALFSHWLKGRPAKPKVVRHLFSCRSDLTRSALEFYRSTLVTLSVHWNQPLLRLPSSEEEARDALFALFEEVRMSGVAKVSPVLLVVDGLDEAAPGGRWDTPFFPKALPEGLHIIVSVRLGDAEVVPTHLAGWVAQCDERQCVKLLDRRALVEWMQKLGGEVAKHADNEATVKLLLEKTSGLPLHLAFIFDDFNNPQGSRMDFVELIKQTPTGFSAYVDMQFRGLVESPVGKERRWQEFFGLLVAAKSELQREDINSILGLTIWDLRAMPAELYRWVSQHNDGYTFRNEALRQAFAQLNPWPDASNNLLTYSRDWQKHHSPYALRSLIGHLRDADNWPLWFATASDWDFLKCQGGAFPYEPLMPLQTIEKAMAQSMTRRDFQSLSRLIFIHATWMPNPRNINPLKFALSVPAMAWQQIKLAELIDPSTEAIWQVLVAWRCAVEGRSEEARQLLSQVTTSSGRCLKVVWAQIFEAILPQLMQVDATLTLKIALAHLDTGALPRFLVATHTPTEAIALTQKWQENSDKRHNASGWVALWRSLAEKGELTAILDATRNLPQEYFANVLFEVSLILAQLKRLDQLQICLKEIDDSSVSTSGKQNVMIKPKLVILASIGSIRLQRGEEAGREQLLEAEAAVDGMDRAALFHKVETMGWIGIAWTRAGEIKAAERSFVKALVFADFPGVPRGVKDEALIKISLCLSAAYRISPELQQTFMDLLHIMEEEAKKPISKDLENDFRRAIATAWDELHNNKRAEEWLFRIPNAQFRGKTLGDFVKRRLKIADPDMALKEARRLIAGVRPGKIVFDWALVQLGNFYLQRKEWNDAATTFARIIQSGTTHGGKIDSIQTSALLGELACAFDTTGKTELAVRHVEAAIGAAKRKRGPIGWRFLLNVVERTYWLRSTDLGPKTLEETTAAAFADMNDKLRVPLLCAVAQIQHLVARKPQIAQEALSRATAIIRNHITDPVLGMIARCEITETLHLCGLDEQAQQRLGSISAFAQQRTSRPSDKADEVIAEAALGHARADDVDGAKRLLELLGDRQFDAATRAWAIIYTYEGSDKDADEAVCRIKNGNYRAKIRRDLACTLIKLGRVDQALVVAQRIDVDRDNALPRIAMALIENGFQDAFFKLIISATRFPNAAVLMLAGLLRLHPELAQIISELLAEYVPDILSSQSKHDRKSQMAQSKNMGTKPQVSESGDTEMTNVQE